MIHEKLAHLSVEQIRELITRYYEGIDKVQDLIDEYAIDVRPNALNQLFPPRVHPDLTCPHCSVNLVTPLESRSSTYPNRPHCPRCGHQNGQHCGCQNCREAVKKHHLDIQTRKQQLVDAEYPRIVDLPTPDEATLRDAVFLLALSTHSLTEDLRWVDPYEGQVGLAPTYDLKNEIVKHLYAKGFISLSNTSPMEAFVFDDAVTSINAYYPVQAVWEFMPGYSTDEKLQYLKELRGIIKDTWPPEWGEDIHGLWLDIAKYECIEYFLFMIEQRGYSIEKLGEKTHDVFETLLEDFSVSQIFNLSWQAVRDTTDYIVRENLPKYHGKNIFIGAVQKKGEKALAEGWEVRSSRRDYNCPQTIVSSTFFNLFLGMGDRAFETIPRLGAEPLAEAS